MDINAANIAKSTTHFLHRYHVIVFVVIVLGTVGAGVFIAYQNILSVDDNHGYTAQANNISFDEETRKRLAELHTADYRMPSNPGADVSRNLFTAGGRVNPFVE